MIIIKYLTKEIFKNQLIILSILFLIFFCQKLIRILDATINGDIPAKLILFSLWIGTSEMGQLILPLSLFLSILITLNRMLSEREIIVMYSCNLGNNILIKTIIILGTVTTLIALINIIWISPWSARYQDKIIWNAKNNLNVFSLLEGQFKKINNDLIFFIGNIKNNKFYNLFLAQIKYKNNIKPFIVTASKGRIIQHSNNSQLIILNKGIRYEGTALMHNFNITNFNEYKAIIKNKDIPKEQNNTEQMTIYQLWKSSKIDACTELHWRLTLISSIFIMAFIALPLSITKANHGYILGALPAILLYLFFFFLQTLLRYNGTNNIFNPTIWIWFVNISYLILAFFLNIWNSIPLRKLRWKIYSLYKKNIHV